MRRAHGGLWVGGTVRLTRDRVTFEPNAMNRSLHVGACDFDVPLEAIREVGDRFGVLTGIIDLHTDAGTFTVRCFGAKRFAQRIRDQQSAARGP